VKVHDTAKGRYLLTTDHDGWITVRGADSEALLAQLATEQQSLTGNR
jgi:hypothetical protein